MFLPRDYLNDLRYDVHLPIPIRHYPYHAALDCLLEERLPTDLLEECPAEPDLLEVSEFYLDHVLLGLLLVVVGGLGVFHGQGVLGVGLHLYLLLEVVLVVVVLLLVHG